MANQANIQQVRYTTDMGGDQNPFLTLLNAFGTGMVQKKNMPNQLLQSAFPNLVATKQIRPAQPGESTIMPNVPWTWNNSLDIEQLNQQALLKERLQNLDPNYQASQAAFKEIMSRNDKLDMLNSVNPNSKLKPDYSDENIESIKDVWNRTHGQTSQAQTQSRVKKATRPLVKGGKTYPLTYQKGNQTYHLGTDGMYYTPEEF